MRKAKVADLSFSLFSFKMYSNNILKARFFYDTTGSGHVIKLYQSETP